MAKDYYQIILKDFHLKDEDVINVYPFGSKIYGTDDYKSDWDFVVVVKDGVVDKDIRKSSHNQINVNIFTETSFLAAVKRHRMSMLECIFLPSDKLLKNSKTYSFKLDIKSLHQYIITKSLEDWGKARLKFDQQDVSYIKSIFHSIRTLRFGIQLAENNNIEYSSCNDLWHELNNNFVFDSWRDCNAHYCKYNLKLVKEFADKFILNNNET